MPSDVVVAGLIELGKLSLQGFFSAMAQAGQTPDQINAMFVDEFAEFKTKHPDKLKDV